MAVCMYSHGMVQLKRIGPGCYETSDGAYEVCRQQEREDNETWWYYRQLPDGQAQAQK